MGQYKILEKLNKFLKHEASFEKESNIVYLLVELRKLLDIERENGVGTNTYELVRFHADWAVHTKKDRITQTMKKILTNVANALTPYPTGKHENLEFLLQPEFRKELVSLLESYNLPHNFCDKDAEWRSFMISIAGILSEQPLVNPTEIIGEFVYIDMGKEGLVASITFIGQRNGNSITVGILE